MKSKKQVESSSSSSSEEEDKDDVDDDKSSDDDQASSSSSSDVDEETIKLIQGVEKLIHKLNVKGVPIQIEDCIFTNQRRKQRNKECYGCSKKGHFVDDCPNNPTPKAKKKACKAKALKTIKTWDDSSSKEEAHHKRRDRKHSSSRSSHMCLMARETCTQEVAMENEQLKQEVARLTKDLIQVKCKMEQAQPHQYNTVKGVKKLDEGATVVCYVCHNEGRKLTGP
nr:uncharacterized protein LOC117856242 [Setaria viridis]